MPKIEKWYTATGDDGTTGLLGEGRVKKHHPRPEAYGTVDETQTALGLARAVMKDREAAEVILRVQRDLYQVMAELAATKEAAPKFRTIGEDQVTWLEQQTDHYGAQLDLPPEFIMSGDSYPGAALDMGRTISRRAERRVVKLLDDNMIENIWLIRYLNRLSSLLFVLARYEDALSGTSKVTLAKEEKDVADAE
jgi:cob(I)alamin adenosyltransferase